MKRKKNNKKEVQRIINELIFLLYKPSGKDNIRYIPDWSRIKKMKINENEPINWMDLKCYEVYRDNDVYTAIVDEAAPEACPTFCEYIRTYMEKFGYKVTVKTEW